MVKRSQAMRLSPEQVWQMVRTERLRLVEDLEELEPQQWNTASPCPGWDVRETPSGAAYPPLKQARR